MMPETILQAFEWYLPNDGQHWVRLTQMAKKIKHMGFTAVWLPPADKCAAGVDDVGYGTYDLYDLGEFDQKGTVRTKYGTKDEYLACIKALHEAGLKVYPDIVVDHFMGADEAENVKAKSYSFDDRLKPTGKTEEIKAWTKFTFPGRQGKYNDYTWHWQNFTGIDYDGRSKNHAIYKFHTKEWEPQVDSENGNFDYLMGCDLDMSNPETKAQLDKWGKWFQALTQADGYRLDAVKHIKFTAFVDWLLHRRAEHDDQLFVVGEYWSDDIQALINYLNSSGNLVTLFDVPLHFNLYEAAHSMGDYDMRHIFDNTLISERPDFAVTFVDNHDTQVGQSLESWVDGWFKLQAYALILLRSAGIPTVFWGDLMGIPEKDSAPVGKGLTRMLKIREYLAFGGLVDYIDDPNIIGWTRTGDFDHDSSGYAVIMTNKEGGEKKMTVSAVHAGQTFVDMLGNNDTEVQLDENGVGVFPVNDAQVSVYVNKEVVKALDAEEEMN
ncbi:alpha-amylase [Schleiferilactobacillus perolens]|nr:alpha-amylase [Schleiferilactobacillus perolens]MCI1890743.1 alpha-amylase [Schleiferilactobacillus harbinensis]MCI1912241.1 alpha-amylase [Schleiferilactobacillus harbinensis]MCI2171898.1 alpha-amylase [Schleiferilactobacillus perolens]